MSNGIRLTRNQLKIIALDASAGVKASIEAALSGGANPKPERDKQVPLVGQAKAETGMVYLNFPVLVIITGRCPRPYDDDNFSGGCKELRDAIAAALSFKGDSEKDGIRFEYVQEKGQAETIIEVYEQ